MALPSKSVVTAGPRRPAKQGSAALAALLLASGGCVGPRPVAAQGPVFSRLPNQQWRVRNAAATASFWALLEVEFHLAPACDHLVRGAPFASGFVGASESGRHGPNLAFDLESNIDAALEMSWWAQCVGGCAVGEAWLGQDFDLGSYDVRCVRILQVPDASHAADMVALDQWDGSAFVPRQTFRDVDFGYVVNLPVDALAKWRLLAVDAPAGWEVTELSFFADVECGEPAGGGGGVWGASGHIGNGSAASDLANPPAYASDGSVETRWTAPPSSSSFVGWLEQRMRQPGEVLCARLRQVRDRAADHVLLQAWTGSEYENASSFSALSPGGVWDRLVRWEACARAAGELWRLLPNEVVASGWTVFEFELHSDVNCSLALPLHAAIASGSAESHALGDGPNASIDEDTSSAWTAGPFLAAPGQSWRGWYAGNSTMAHELGHPWLGAHTDPGQKVLCVRLLQSNALEASTSTLVVQRWSGSAWEDHREIVPGAGEVALWYSGLTSWITPVGHANWLRLPGLDRSQWRLTHLERLWEHWALKELQFFETVECRYAVTGLHIGSDEDPFEPAHTARYAFDGELSTEWWSECSYCAPKQAWVGVHPPRPRNVRCVRLFQSGIAPQAQPVPWWTTKAGVEKWNGHRWVHVTEFQGLGRGAWEHLLVYAHAPSTDDAASGLDYWTTAENKLWRVTHLDELPERWAVASLSFHLDFDCIDPIDDAQMISSGYVIDFGMVNAFGDDASTEWLSPCEGCSARQAWIGLHMPSPRQVRCVRLFQSVRPKVGSRAVAVERWDGLRWAQAAFGGDLVPGSWELLRIAGVGAGGGVGSSPPSAYTWRWRVANDEPVERSWQITGLRFYTSIGCRGEAEGFLIESGHTQGHEPAAAVDEDLTTYWESSCRGCERARAWLGLLLSAGAAAPRCVQLRQPRDTSSAASAIVMESWAEDSWSSVARFGGLNYGAWDHMHLLTLPQLLPGIPAPEPALAGALWRIANAAAIERHWVVRLLGFYSGVDKSACVGLLEGVPIVSGQADDLPPDGPFMAPGRNFSTRADWPVWRSECTGCGVGVAWIGLAMMAAAEVRCVQLEQAAENLDSTPAINLERWDGTAWRLERSFVGVSGGAELSLSDAWERPAPLQRARIVALAAPSGGRWRVAELSFFANVECNMAVHGSALSSGSYLDAVAQLAFDGDISTAWEAMELMQDVVSDDLWLGAHFGTPHDVKCARVFQGTAGEGRWSTSLALERWAGDGWQRALTLNAVSDATWLTFNTFSSMLSDVRMNFQDQATVTPQSWFAEIGRPYSSRPPSGLTYGFSCDLSGVDRGYHVDALLDTLVPLECHGATWNLDVLSGRYYVTITYSDPGHGGLTAGCSLEGTSVASGQIPMYESVSREAIVDVFDSQLTFAGSKHTECDSVSTLEARALPQALTMWRVVNGASVVGHWRINEYELHASSSCSLNIFAIRAMTTLASGHYQNAEPALALDGDITTSWASPCLDCASGEAWLGAAFETSQVIKCLKLYQGLEGDGHAGVVLLERWNKTGWELAETFRDTPGGQWAGLNEIWVRPPGGHRWRVANNQPLESALYVAEVRLFSDVACTTPLLGFPIASGVRRDAPAARAFDGDLESEWASPCAPCGAGEAWVGLHYSVSAEVLCVSVAMGLASGLVGAMFGMEASIGEVRLQLEAWNGSTWSSAKAIVPARPGAWASASRFRALADSDLPPGSLWRLVSLEATSAPWRVLEVEFHTQSQCHGLISGTPLASSEKLQERASLAFDASTEYSSAWVAGCGARGCAAGVEWLGSLFSEAYAFQCVRIYQATKSLAGDPAAHVLRIERWGGARAGWESVRTFGAGGGAPVPSGKWANLVVVTSEDKFSTGAEEWRIVSEDALEKHWAVVEVAFFDNVECKGQLSGTPASSGSAGNRFVTGAVDGRLDTSWWSEASMPPLGAWVGLAFGDKQVVKCVQLIQLARPEGFSTPRVQLQSLPEVDWLHIFSFDHVAAGQPQNLHVFEAVAGRPEGAMWRVLNYDAVPDGWVLVELEFYADVGCTRIEIGEPLASGHTIDHQPEFAFDVRLGTHWRAPCRDCAQSRAWLGQSFFRLGEKELGAREPRSVDIRCIVLLQGEAASNASSSRTVSVERWDGATWRRHGKFVDVPSGEFVQLRFSPEGDDDLPLVVDFERKAMLLVSTPPPSDSAVIRGGLALNHDVVEVDVRMYVDSWPLELSSSLEASNAFVDAFAVALPKAVAARARQLLGHVYADDVLLNVPRPGASGEAARASMSAILVVYVAREGANYTKGADLETDAAVVEALFRDISEDPRALEALFMVDKLKTELRRATRLDPLQASVATQIGPGMELRFGTPRLTVAFPPPEVTSTTRPTDPPPLPVDQTVQYAILVGGLLLLLLSAMWARSCYFLRKRYREEKEIWELSHPGRRYRGPGRLAWLTFGLCGRHADHKRLAMPRAPSKVVLEKSKSHAVIANIIGAREDGRGSHPNVAYVAGKPRGADLRDPSSD